LTEATSGMTSSPLRMAVSGPHRGKRSRVRRYARSGQPAIEEPWMARNMAVSSVSDGGSTRWNQ
jgi:hypothetical protein